jgi:hypothetical protein
MLLWIPVTSPDAAEACYYERQGAGINKVLYSFGLIIAAGYAWRFFNPGGLDRNRVRHALSVGLFLTMPVMIKVLLRCLARRHGSTGKIK